MFQRAISVHVPGPRRRHPGNTVMIIQVLIQLVSCLLATCAAQQPADFTDIRLVGGPVNAPNSGRVEVLHSAGIWLNVCDYDYWGDNDGEVACRQLGFPGYSRTRRESYFGEGTNNGSVGGIGCSGNEDSLGQCNHQPVQESMGCEGRGAGLICTAPGFLGCYTDRSRNRVFTNPRFTAQNMTIALCLDRCRKLGMRYAGLENRRDCYCGDEGTQIDKYGRKRDRDCKNACLGNLDEVCGDRGRLSIYDLTLGHCTDPGTPANGGRVSLSGGVFRYAYAANITFYCNDGFELVGTDTARCTLGDSSQEVNWDEPIPQCIYESMPSTSNPDNGDLLMSGGGKAGKIAGIVSACVILFILLALLTVFVMRKRRRRVNKNKSPGVQLDNAYSEPRDPTRYQTSPGLHAANTEYQDLTLPSGNADRPYTSLKKRDSQQERGKDVPEYLELDVDNSEYASLDEERKNNQLDAARAGGTGAAKRPVGTRQSDGLVTEQCPPSPEINDNEYSYVGAPQLDINSVADNQSVIDQRKHGGTENPEEYADVGSMYYSIPPADTR